LEFFLQSRPILPCTNETGLAAQARASSRFSPLVSLHAAELLSAHVPLAGVSVDANVETFYWLS
jgi:hypothetical protein